MRMCRHQYRFGLVPFKKISLFSITTFAAVSDTCTCDEPLMLWSTSWYLSGQSGEGDCFCLSSISDCSIEEKDWKIWAGVVRVVLKIRRL